MQPHNAAPRSGARREDVLALITADDVWPSFGATLLDERGRELADVSAAFDPAQTTITWTGADALPLKIDAVVNRPFRWDADRIRVHRDLTSPSLGVTLRFYRGVFLLNLPKHTVDDRVWVPSGLADDGDQVDATGAPTAAGPRKVSGYSTLSLLDCKIGRSWQTEWSPGGDPPTLGSEVDRLIAASRWTGQVLLHPSAYTTPILEPQSWPYDAQGGAGFLRVLREMCTGCGFETPWDDEAGALRARPLQEAAERGAEFTLDADDAFVTIMGPERTRTEDIAKTPNSFHYVASSWPRATSPGDGEVILEPNTSDGPASIAQRGVVWNDDVAVDGVTTQDALEAVARARRERDLRGLGVREVSTGALPLMGHLDCYRVRDAGFGASRLAIARTWTEPQKNDAGAWSALTLEELPL